MNVVSIKFPNKSWAVIGYQIVPWKVKESPKIIWQPKVAQDLLWNLTFTTLLELILMSLNLLLQGGPHLFFITEIVLKCICLIKIPKYLLFYCNVYIYIRHFFYMFKYLFAFIWVFL